MATPLVAQEHAGLVEHQIWGRLMTNVATHESPAWGPRANFIIRADLSKYGMAGRLEQLWAFKIEETVFEICCIPFFTYGIALADKVECNHEYTVQRVIEKGDHKTLRVAVSDKRNQNHHLHEVLHEWADNTGLLYEWCGAGYLAVDVPPFSEGKLNLSVLDPLSKAGEIFIEMDE
jgi:hypothetical protein